MNMTKAEGLKLKIGDEVDIFEDPNSEQELEGIAEIVEIIEITDHCIYMDVRFGEHELPVMRRIVFI